MIEAFDKKAVYVSITEEGIKLFHFLGVLHVTDTGSLVLGNANVPWEEQMTYVVQGLSEKLALASLQRNISALQQRE